MSPKILTALVFSLVALAPACCWRKKACDIPVCTPVAGACETVVAPAKKVIRTKNKTGCRTYEPDAALGAYYVDEYEDDYEDEYYQDENAEIHKRTVAKRGSLK